jgi:HPt (histidine-containing phosphotransfer) domain-containing protein
MTADAMVGTKEACLDAGMNEYISKPIMEEELQEIISGWLIIDKDNVGSPQPDSKKRAPANLSILREYADNDTKVEKELLSIFYTKSKQDIEILGKNLKGGKKPEWSEAAHSLKGSASYIGADQLHHLCAKAQDMLQATGRERRDLFEEIEVEYQRVCDYLKTTA